jgi:hypothetical protein
LIKLENPVDAISNIAERLAQNGED